MARSNLSFRLTASFVILNFVLSQAPKDPLRDFCRRFSHQTALVGRHLYIDGGYVNANPLSQNPQAVPNPNLLVQNLDILENGMPTLSANLSKNPTVPSVSGGTLWADDVNQVFYLYGGEYPLVPDGFALWTSDVPFNSWNLTVQSTSSPEVERVAWGAGITVEGRAEGYYYGGYLNNNTTPGWNAPQLATSNLIRYDMIGNSWTNSTGPDSIGRAEGVMVTIPASRQGLLVYFGGVSFPHGNSTEEASPMTAIFLYDIAESKWYQQNATGHVPENRRKFCAGVTWAQDQSSYNIYLYGGAGFAENATGFDDVYILTLPSFTWIKWYPAVPGLGNPHNSLTCNVIDNAQMLIIGGTFPATNTCDAPVVWGTHNLDLGQNNPEKAKWNLFNPNLTTYIVPSEILSVVGGSSTGGATATAPAGGWDDRDLPVYFQQQATYAARTPTRVLPTTQSAPNHSSKSDNGAVIGGAVGGVIAFLLLVAVATFLCIRSRRGRQSNEELEMTQARERPPSELNVRSSAPDEASTPSPTAPSMSTHLPAYLKQKPLPTPVTTTHPAVRPPNPASLVHSYTTTPPPMIGTAIPYQQHRSSALHPTSSLITQFATPLQSPTYAHPAHSPPFQQQPYFPPPPTREYHAPDSDALMPNEQREPPYEMPGVNSPRPKKKTWND